MKKTLGIVGIMLLAEIAAVQSGGWFVQDFEAVATGPYTELPPYDADGVEVTLTADAGHFLVIDSGLHKLLGGHSVVTSKSKRSTVNIQFSDVVYGVTVDALSECGFEDRIPSLTCFDVDGSVVFKVRANRARPCNQFSMIGASIIGEKIIASCEIANGMFDNLILGQ